MFERNIERRIHVRVLCMYNDTKLLAIQAKIMPSKNTDRAGKLHSNKIVF